MKDMYDDWYNWKGTGYDPGIDWKNQEEVKLTVDIDKDFEHTPVDVLIFASDPVRGREYELYLKEEYTPGEVWSDKRFAEYMKRAEGFERTANKMAPRDEMLPTPTGKERLQQSGYYLT